jgi:hypothetical protein
MGSKTRSFLNQKTAPPDFFVPSNGVGMDGIEGPGYSGQTQIAQLEVRSDFKEGFLMYLRGKTFKTRALQIEVNDPETRVFDGIQILFQTECGESTREDANFHRFSPFVASTDMGGDRHDSKIDSGMLGLWGKFQ